MLSDNYADMTPEGRVERVAELRQALAEHPGRLASARWESVSRSVGVVLGNAADLTALLNAPATDHVLAMELVQNVRPPIVRDRYMLTVDQRLHNLIASVRSLVDHRRRHMSRYAGTAFAVEFGTRNQRVIDLPESAFLNALRNYLLHFGTAPLVSQLNWNQEGMQSRVLISASALLAADFNWKAHERASITSLDPEAKGIDLLQVVTTYLAALAELNEWWSAQFTVLHAEEVADANEIIMEMNLTMTGGAAAAHDWEGFMAHVGQNLARHSKGEEQVPYETSDVTQK